MLAALGRRRPLAAPRDVRLRALRRAGRRPHPGAGPARHQAAVRPAARRRDRVRLRAQGAGRRPSGRSSRSTRERSSPRRCSTSCPRNAAPSRRSTSSRPGRGPSGGPTAAAGPGGTGTRPPRRWPRRSGPNADLAAVFEESVAAHLVADVPVASFLSGGLDSSLVTAMAANRDPSIEAYTITFRPEDQQLEAMPDDATLRPQDGRAPRHPAARDRDQPGRRRPAAADGRRPRRADRRPGGHQHPADVPGRPRRRGQGPAVRDGRRRAVRRLPQAPGLPARRALPEAAPAACGPEWWRRASTGSRSPRAAGVCATVRWAKRFLSFAELPEEAAFRRSYTLYDPTSWPACSTRRWVRCVDDVVDAHRALYTDTELTDHVNRMCLADSRLFLPGLNLAYTDRSSMAASTEVRVPFVDPRCSGPPSRFRGSREDQGPDAEGRAAGRRRGAGCPTRSSTGPRRRSALRCGPGSPTTSGRWSTTSCSTASWSAPGSCARAAAAAAGRRPAQRAARPVEAGLAAAQPGALVPQRPRRRGGAP